MAYHAMEHERRKGVREAAAAAHIMAKVVEGKVAS
jgi:hypothetical protein